MDAKKIKLESIRQTIVDNFPNIKNLNVYWKGDQIRWDFDKDEIHTGQAIFSCVVTPILQMASDDWNREHAEDCSPDKAVRISAKLEFKDKAV